MTKEVFVLTLCGLALFVSTCSAQIDCTGREDGNYGYGCRSYTKCSGGRGTVVDCQPGFVFDIVESDCRPIDEVPPPCGSQQDCSILADGKYPILPDCRFYFTCGGGIFLGSNPCNNPPDVGDLVFDIEMQICNWRWDTQEPCGTYVPPTVPPSEETTSEQP